MKEGKVVSTRAYVSVLKELVESGKEASMIVWGGSMTPFLGHNRDRIFFSAPDRPIRRGDMVFYERKNGAYVMHRVLRVRGNDCFMVGDAQTEVEGPVSREQIFALVTRVQRKGKLIGPDDFWWRFFAGPWLVLRPFRGVILRCYSLLRHRK